MKVGKWYSVGLNQLTDYHRLTPAEDLPPWMLLGGAQPSAGWILQAFSSIKIGELSLFCYSLASERVDL